jgi:hypothetical protein
VWGACCREKESGGALDIPGGNKLIELEYAQVEDRKLRGQLRNVSKLELLVRPRSPCRRTCKVGRMVRWAAVPWTWGVVPDADSLTAWECLATGCVEGATLCS